MEETYKKAFPATFPLRLPRSVCSAARVLAEAGGISLNEFIKAALERKIARLRAMYPEVDASLDQPKN